MAHLAIGVAGLMGSGKTSLAKSWALSISAQYFDVDTIAKELMDSSHSIRQEIQREFNVVEASGIQYGQLGKIVFNSSEKLEVLNSIVHPPLIEHLNRIIAETDGVLIIDAALHTLWEPLVHIQHGIWIEASDEIRKKRIMERNSLDEATVRKRIERQTEMLPSPSSFWNVIQNESLLEKAVVQGERLICEWLERA